MQHVYTTACSCEKGAAKQSRILRSTTGNIRTRTDTKLLPNSYIRIDMNITTITLLKLCKNN